ncbi:MAG TPA: sulfur carrier protein ThiS [Dehalococcoidia bacterium]|nr:sulfur carrier protein ThiS [Dehalococcoidia bacterium]
MTGATISLVINGKPRELPASTSLPALLELLGVDRRMIAVAHNGDVIPRDSYDGIVLSDGDHVEVVRMVGGG